MPDEALPTLVRGTLAEFKRRLQAQLGSGVLALKLFGSYSRRAANEDSDVDVFVLLESAGWKEKKQVLDIAGDLWAETGLLISPSVFARAQYEVWRRQERPLVMDIDRDGVLL